MEPAVNSVPCEHSAGTDIYTVMISNLTSDRSLRLSYLRPAEGRELPTGLRPVNDGLTTGCSD